MDVEQNDKPKGSSRSLPWREFEEALVRAVDASWEALSSLEGDPIRVFGVCLNDAGGTIEAHALTQSDLRRLMDQWGGETSEAEVCLSLALFERKEALSACYREVAALYDRIEPKDVDDEAAWDRIHERVERLVLKVLRGWRSLHKALAGNGPLLFVTKTTGMSDAESQAYLNALNPPDVLEKWFGVEPPPLGKAGNPCGPANRSCQFRDMRLSPDRERLALTGWDNQLLTWWVGDTTRAERTQYIREGRAESLAWLSGNVLLVLLTKRDCVHETSVCFWFDIAKGKRGLWLGPENGLKSSMDLDVDPRRERVWLATKKGCLQAFSLEGTLERELEMDGEWIRHVRISPDGRWLAACSDGYGICVWRADIFQLEHTWKGQYADLCFSGDSRWITASSNSETLPLHQPIWDLETGAMVWDMPLERLKDGEDFLSLEVARCAAFHPSKPWLAVSQGYGEGSTLLSVWEIESGNCLGRFSDGHECVRALVWQGDGLFYTGDHGRGAALYVVEIPGGGMPSFSFPTTQGEQLAVPAPSDGKKSPVRKSAPPKAKRIAKTNDLKADHCVECLVMIKSILEVWPKMQGEQRVPALEELGDFFQSGEPIISCPMDGALYLPPNTEIPFYHCPHETHTADFLKLVRRELA